MYFHHRCNPRLYKQAASACRQHKLMADSSSRAAADAARPASSSKAAAARHIYSLYRRDKLVLHSMPEPLIDVRPIHLSDGTTMLSASICFYNGIYHQPTCRTIPNAVARFGDDAYTTCFGTLHDLDLIWQVHERLEAQKPETVRGRPFVYFTNCDMCDLAHECGGQPCKLYPQAAFQQGAAAGLQRTRSFDFRRHCETTLCKDDPRKHADEWNELRAVLCCESLVGLLYIADPQHDPRSQVEPLAQLHARVLQRLGRDLPVAVFQVHEPGGITGELLVREEGQQGHAEVQEGAQEGAADGCTVGSSCSAQVVLFEEYLAEIRDALKEA